MPDKVDAMVLYEQVKLQWIPIAAGLIFSVDGRSRNCTLLHAAGGMPVEEIALETPDRLAASQRLAGTHG